MGGREAAVGVKRGQLDRRRRRAQVGRSIEPCAAVGVDVVAQRGQGDVGVAAGVRREHGVLQADGQDTVAEDAAAARRRVVRDGRVGDAVAAAVGVDAAAVGAGRIAADGHVAGAEDCAAAVDAAALLHGAVAVDRSAVDYELRATALVVDAGAGLGLVVVDPAVADGCRSRVAQGAAADRGDVAHCLDRAHGEGAGVVDAGASIGDVVLEDDVGQRHARPGIDGHAATLGDVPAVLDGEVLEADIAAQYVEHAVVGVAAAADDGVAGVGAAAHEGDVAEHVEVARGVEVFPGTQKIGQREGVGAAQELHRVVAGVEVGLVDGPAQRPGRAVALGGVGDVGREQAVPGLLPRSVDGGGALNMAGDEFQGPVAAARQGAGRVGAGSDVGAGQGCQRPDEILAAGTRGDVAAVDQDVGVGVEGLRPAGDRIRAQRQRGAVQDGVAQHHAPLVAVRQQVQGG